MCCWMCENRYQAEDITLAGTGYGGLNLKSFEFFEPTTLAEASRLFAAEHAQLLAGGTDLVIGMKALTETPQSVISLQKIPGLAGITTEADNSISIGAMTKVREVELSADILQHHTALAEGAAEIGSIQIRNLATVGGNIAHASPAADTVAGLLVADAQVDIASADGERTVPINELFTGPGQTVLTPGEIITRFRLPSPASGSHYIKHKIREVMDLAFIGVAAINPNLSKAAVEEMLIQHLLTERIFRTVFNNPDFTRRNTIAREIENVIEVLIGQTYSRDAFLKVLNPFYLAIEQAALLCQDFSQKQQFLNTVYEQFFQGFSVEVADTHGIVYTPQPIVDFMVKSVAHILETEFDRSLSDPGVHIIDPFVGTGNFIVRLLQDIQATTLEDKYRNALYCNEILLLPYYVASLNIEHEYFQRTGTYLPFEGIALADTFELLEEQQIQLFTQENTARVEKQKTADMFVVIGNPPYNVGQVNENDNNKNRPYKRIAKFVRETYSQDSKATNKNALSDPYVKAILWASKRIGGEGVVAFVTNNGFLDGIAFDGMRKHLAQDFTKIYHIDLKGNARTSGERRRQEGGNVFDDQIRVGVGITFFIKTTEVISEPAEVWIYSVDDYLKAREKQKLLTDFGDYTNVPVKQAKIDTRHTWLTEGLHSEFDTFIPMGTKEAKAVKGAALGVIFKNYSRGINTSRDAWAYNFNRNGLDANIQGISETYNTEVTRWVQRINRDEDLDNFVVAEDTKISWSEALKRNLQRGKTTDFSQDNVRIALYRPFVKSYLYFDRMLIERVYVFPSIFPTLETETENRIICLTALGSKKPFHCLMAQQVTDVHLTGDSQCFPFYTYNEDGTNRQENITDWALTEFQTHYGDNTLTKWDIFHYTYALLHHPDYREKYQANLKRDLPHIPFVKDFWGFAKAGAVLADLHVNYESVPKYEELQLQETSTLPRIDWQVEKMRFSKDKTQIHYNDYFTLVGIPPEAFEYRLGSRSAVEWIVDQYRVKVDKRSGIRNDPNRSDAPQYIVDLIGRVITVSLRTVEIVRGLPRL